jgi:predicted nucleic acid-binding protein
MIAIVDAGPLYAAVDADDQDHARSVACLQRPDLDLVVPAMVIAEVTYLVGRRLGPLTEAAFLRAIAALAIESPTPDDLERMAELVDRYGDLPLGGTDASVAALADRLGTRTVITLDRRHFGVIRSGDGAPFELLPD